MGPDLPGRGAAGARRRRRGDRRRRARRADPSSACSAGTRGARLDPVPAGPRAACGGPDRGRRSRAGARSGIQSALASEAAATTRGHPRAAWPNVARPRAARSDARASVVGGLGITRPPVNKGATRILRLPRGFENCDDTASRVEARPRGEQDEALSRQIASGRLSHPARHGGYGPGGRPVLAVAAATPALALAAPSAAQNVVSIGDVSPPFAPAPVVDLAGQRIFIGNTSGASAGSARSTSRPAAS